jgi:hypothetical protein
VALGFPLQPPTTTHDTSRSGRDHDYPHHIYQVHTTSERQLGAHSVRNEVPFRVTKQPERG